MPKEKKKEKSKPRGGFVLVSGWNWTEEGDISCLKFGRGVELRELRKRKGSNEMSLLLWSGDFAKGEAVMDYTAAKVLYPMLSPG